MAPKTGEGFHEQGVGTDQKPFVIGTKLCMQIPLINQRLMTGKRKLWNPSSHSASWRKDGCPELNAGCLANLSQIKSIGQITGMEKEVACIEKQQPG
ncbi:MAG: hypothetical protein WCK64_03315 [Synechococcaceae cyanobacterium ELA445]